MPQNAFNNKEYFNAEITELQKRRNKFDVLYIEIGGHLLVDEHAARVLPGYKKDNKLQMIKRFKETAFVYCINSKELNKNNTWGTSKKKIEEIALYEIKKLKEKGLDFLCVVLGMYTNKQKKSVKFKKKLEEKGIKVLTTKTISGYPKKLENVFGKNGFASQTFLKTKKKMIVVTGIGADSGKMFFCLSQIYHLEKNGIDAGYAKIETFPVWNLPITHEVNLAYEAATADIKDKVMIDPFYKKTYGKIAINYNRDINAFPVLKKIILKITSKKNFMQSYFSPTDMGINMVKKGIVNDKKIREASAKEIRSRHKKFLEKYQMKKEKKETIVRLERIISEISVK